MSEVIFVEELTQTYNGKHHPWNYLWRKACL